MNDKKRKKKEKNEERDKKGQAERKSKYEIVMHRALCLN